jgi:hypothetical protein
MEEQNMLFRYEFHGVDFTILKFKHAWFIKLPQPDDLEAKKEGADLLSLSATQLTSWPYSSIGTV